MNNIKAFPRNVNSFQVKDIFPNEELRHNPLSYISNNLTKSDLLVFQEIMKIARRCVNVYVSHEYIACKINRCRKTVVRAVAKLKELGLVNYLFRHNHSSLYRPSSFLLYQWVRDSLKQIIPALSWISSQFLYSFSFAVPSINSQMSHDIRTESSLSLLSSSKSLILVNYDKNKGSKVVSKESRMNPLVEKLRELLHLEFHEAQGLTKYPDWILKKAINRIDKIMQVQHKSQYLFALCEFELRPKPKIEQAYSHLKKKYGSTSDNSETFNQPKPPIYKVHVSKPIVLEKVSDDKLRFAADEFKKLSENNKTGLNFSNIFNCIKNLYDATRIDQ